MVMNHHVAFAAGLALRMTVLIADHLPSPGGRALASPAWVGLRPNDRPLMCLPSQVDRGSVRSIRRGTHAAVTTAPITSIRAASREMIHGMISGNADPSQSAELDGTASGFGCVMWLRESAEP